MKSPHARSDGAYLIDYEILVHGSWSQAIQIDLIH
jgi:hypothetical protein